MFDVGRLCLKMAGRDAGQKCVIVEKLEGKYVMIDGMTRRRKCNTLHLEPLDQTIDLSSGASHAHVVAAFKELGLEVQTKKSRQKTNKPKAVRNVKEKPAIDKKAKKKSAKENKKTEKKEDKKKSEEKKAAKKE
jgi:large subunit ribosomal protein L14e